MEIELAYDSSVNNAPAGFTAAMQYAASQLDALITNNITVSISVSWNDSVFGLGGFNEIPEPYTKVIAALESHATTPAAAEAVSSIPSNVSHYGDLYLSNAQAQALGFATSSSGPGQDGMMTFGSQGAILNFSTTDRAIPGEYDFVGIAEHELTHALGRMADFYGPAEFILDLFRFSGPGTLQTDGYNPTYFSINDGVTALDTFSTSSDLGDWASSAGDDSYDAYANAGVANTLSAADETLLSAIGFDVATCFCAGTHIATSAGGVPVEALAIGDTVLTKFSGPQKIKWIGFRQYAGRFLSGNHLMLPVTIRRGALSPGNPARDLVLSPGHGVCLDHTLVPAWRLVNNLTITQASQVDHITYYHIELATHDVIFAENCEVESFLDDGCRNWFHNADDFYRRYPGGQTPVRACLPRLESGFHLDSIQRRINRRAGFRDIPEPVGGLRGYIDIAGPDRVTGWAQNMSAPERPVRLELRLGGRHLAFILSNQYRADLRRAGLGSGCHAFDFPLPPALDLSGGLSVRRAADGTPLSLTVPSESRAA